MEERAKRKMMIRERKRRKKIMEGIKVVAVILAAVFALLFVVDLFMPTYGFFAKVDAGNVGIVTHFGKIEDKVLPAGFHFTGYFEQVHPINIRTQRKQAELLAFSSDIQQVDLLVSINYNITPDIANTLYRTVGDNYVETLILPRMNEDVKVAVSNYTAESLIANREGLSGEVMTLMQRDLEGYGITVSAVSVENIDFTDSFEAAVEAKQVATQEKQKAQTQEDQKTMEAKQDAERKKIAADAAAEAMRIQADAEAYDIKVKAEAEAEANRKIAETLTEELIRYTQANMWDGKLPGTYVGGSDAIPIIQTDGGDNGE